MVYHRPRGNFATLPPTRYQMLSLLPLCSSFSPAGGVSRAVLPRARPLMVSTLTSTEAIEYLSTSEQSIEAQLAALKSKVEISKLATEEAEAQYAALKNEEIELLQRIQDQAGDRLRELGFTTEAAPVVTQAAPVVTQAAPVVTEAPAAVATFQAAAPEVVQAPAAVAEAFAEPLVQLAEPDAAVAAVAEVAGVATEALPSMAEASFDFTPFLLTVATGAGLYSEYSRLSAVPRVAGEESTAMPMSSLAAWAKAESTAGEGKRNANEIFLAGLANLQKDMKGAYASDPLAAFYADAPTPAAAAPAATSMAASFKSTVAARGGAGYTSNPAFAAARPKIGAKEAAKLAKKAALAESEGVVVPTAMEAPVPEAEKVA